MIVTEPKPRIPDQRCPLCGELQAVIVNGIRVEHSDPSSFSNDKMFVEKDKGYSFCNCHNIFFTDWSNMDKGEYDDFYIKRYNEPNAKIACWKFAEKYIPIIKESFGNRSLGKFLEIGSPNDSVLDVAKVNGWHPIGLDLIKRNSNHGFLEVDFENYEFQKKYDAIWASHIFEHFKDPIGMVKKCAKILVEGGILFVVMPDPWFVDWANNPYEWIHWHIKEHHILWDLDSFCAVLEESGFEIIKKHRNTTYEFLCSGDFHIIARRNGH